MHAKGGGDDIWTGRAIDLAGLLVLAGLVGLLFWFRAQNAAPSERAPGETSAGAITVLFTQPGADSDAADAPVAALTQALLGATQTIDLAVYELDLAPLADALLAASSRGVRVRIVAESDNAMHGQLPRIQAAGIPVVLDRRPSLMHDKFTVIDGREVWTGSMNYSANGVYRNNNNLVRLRSAEVAQRFTGEFEEMFIDDRFSALSLAAGLPPTVHIEGAIVEVLFSPDDHPAGRIVEAVEAASSSIDVLAFSFTSDEIADALLGRMREGVRVRCVMDADQAGGMASKFSQLQGAGMDIRLDGNPGLLHHKVIVIDGATVITGSYNFSQSAETTNDENLVIIRSPDVADAFEAEVDRLYDGGLP